MRAVEYDMCRAVDKRESWGGGNTCVTWDGDECRVILFGNQIMRLKIEKKSRKISGEFTSRGFNGTATSSRMNALLDGCDLLRNLNFRIKMSKGRMWRVPYGGKQEPAESDRIEFTGRY